MAQLIDCLAVCPSGSKRACERFGQTFEESYEEPNARVAGLSFPQRLLLHSLTGCLGCTFVNAGCPRQRWRAF